MKGARCRPFAATVIISQTDRRTCGFTSRYSRILLRCWLLFLRLRRWRWRFRYSLRKRLETLRSASAFASVARQSRQCLFAGFGFLHSLKGWLIVGVCLLQFGSPSSVFGSDRLIRSTTCGNECYQGRFVFPSSELSLIGLKIIRGFSIFLGTERVLRIAPFITMVQDPEIISDSSVTPNKYKTPQYDSLSSRVVETFSRSIQYLPLSPNAEICASISSLPGQKQLNEILRALESE